MHNLSPRMPVGSRCKRGWAKASVCYRVRMQSGEVYAKNEIINPMRTISSSIKITGGALPLVSVRLTKPVPKSRIPDVMKKIKEMKIEAPCQIGDVLIYDILGLDSDLIITKAIDKFDR